MRVALQHLNNADDEPAEIFSRSLVNPFFLLLLSLYLSGSRLTKWRKRPTAIARRILVFICEVGRANK